MSNISRFFHAQNCLRPSLPVEFKRYAQIGGTWCGVCAVEEFKQIEALMALVEDKRSAVTEITADEYAKAASRFGGGAVQRPLPEPTTIVEKAVAGTPLESVEVALQLGTVKPEEAVEEVAPPEAAAPVKRANKMRAK